MSTLAAAVLACLTLQPAFTPVFKQNDPNANLNDYGRIHHDADDPTCAAAAMHSLTDKVNQHLDANASPPTFKQWLDGFHVALIYGAAMRIGAHGRASQSLDAQLVELVGRFEHNRNEPSGSCGSNEWNTCMDDEVGTASGYAWMAAYMKHRPDLFKQQQVDEKIALSERHLRKALKPIDPNNPAELKNGICLRTTPAISPTNDYAGALCNGALTQLATGDAQTFTLNGQKMMLHYGFGLLTSVASAKKGLELAGSSFQFSSDEVLVMQKLLEEVNRHFDPKTREFTFTCVQKNLVNGVWNGTYSQNVDCGWGYKPDMYALKAFFDLYLGGTPGDAYESNDFNAGLYELTGTNFFSYGRFETYGIQAYAWYVLPKTWAPGDAVEWACD